jgi:hypothetical protein
VLIASVVCFTAKLEIELRGLDLTRPIIARETCVSSSRNDEFHSDEFQFQFHNTYLEVSKWVLAGNEGMEYIHKARIPPSNQMGFT